ncbi:MAG: tetratricopeptide repeat protein [Thermodesulfovibrionia bacterium]
MTNEDLEKLKKKVEKDPLSKLFVPFAEEYKKLGMVEEAINTLLLGLENQPDYTSARVALGKIYQNKDMLSEARVEFEKAIKSVPDNLLAHKRLAEIYYKQGEFSKAMEENQIILNLNPNDEEAKAMISSLESRDEDLDKSAQPDAMTPLQAEPASSDKEDDFNEESEDNAQQKQGPKESRHETTEKLPVYEINDEVNSAELGIELPERLKPVTDEPVSEELEEFRKAMKKEPEEPTATETIQKQPGKTNHVQDLPPDSEETVEMRKDEVNAVQAKNDKIVISMSTETMADIYITQRLYDKALNTYKEILASDSENKRIIQKCKELEMLIKIEKEKKTGNS